MISFKRWQDLKVYYFNYLIKLQPKYISSIFYNLLKLEGKYLILFYFAHIFVNYDIFSNISSDKFYILFHIIPNYFNLYKYFIYYGI